MSLSESDRELVVAELGRDPTPAEEALFENLWSEHCAYRSSRPLLSAFESESEEVVIGPGDDAAVVALDESTYITMGIESHNHPSYVDPYDGAATGVGGIVRDTLSMGAYPIALADSLYFGEFDREHSRYLLEGVVEGIADYGNSIGVPTVTGSTQFHPDYEGNPLVNVACVGLLPAERLITAEAQTPGNKLLLVGNSTGRDGLGGASFASEDLAEDAETEDRPAVQVGDPYTEKLLIEANEELVDGGLVESARDLGAAGLGGASSELVAKGDLGADIELDRVHQREPNMNALEILLAESQERMVYEVRPENVDAVADIAEKYDLGCTVIGDVTDGNYVCEFDGEIVVDVPAEFIGDGAPMNDLPSEAPTQPERDLPESDVREAFEAVVGSPNCASKSWVYRQYDHEVQTRTSVLPGDDSAVLAVRRAELGLAFSSGANPNWTTAAPYDGARAVALENATNLAAKGATPLAAVDCLNGGNPEKPDVYGGFKGIVDGLADMCSTLGVPVVGGNVSLYNDSPSGPIPPTPTLAMTGTTEEYDAPPTELRGRGNPPPRRRTGRRTRRFRVPRAGRRYRPLPGASGERRGTPRRTPSGRHAGRHARGPRRERRRPRGDARRDGFGGRGRGRLARRRRRRRIAVQRTPRPRGGRDERPGRGGRSVRRRRPRHRTRRGERLGNAPNRPRRRGTSLHGERNRSAPRRPRSGTRIRNRGRSLAVFRFGSGPVRGECLASLSVGNAHRSSIE